MNPLVLHVAPYVVTATDIIAVANGADWTQLHARKGAPGAASPNLRFDSDTRNINIQRSPQGPGQVPWSDIAAFIRLGVTPAVIQDLTRAYRSYCANSGAMTAGVWTPGDPGAYETANRQMSHARRVVIRRAALRWQATTQLDLFTPATATPASAVAGR